MTGGGGIFLVLHSSYRKFDHTIYSVYTSYCMTHSMKRQDRCKIPLTNIPYQTLWFQSDINHGTFGSILDYESEDKHVSSGLSTYACSNGHSFRADGRKGNITDTKGTRASRDRWEEEMDRTSRELHFAPS